jgi:hypothetical protein
MEARPIGQCTGLLLLRVFSLCGACEEEEGGGGAGGGTPSGRVSAVGMVGPCDVAVCSVAWGQ